MKQYRISIGAETAALVDTIGFKDKKCIRSGEEYFYLVQYTRTAKGRTRSPFRRGPLHLTSVVAWRDLQTLRNNIMLRRGYIRGLPDRIPQSRIILSCFCPGGIGPDLCWYSENRNNSPCGLTSQVLGGLVCVPISLGSLTGACVGEICHAPSK